MPGVGTGFNPGNKLSATETNSEQLRPPESTESQLVRLDRSGWGPGGRRFKSCLPDHETPAKNNSRFAGANVWGPIIGPILDPEQPAIGWVGSPWRFPTCDRTVPSRVVAGWLRPERSLPEARQGSEPSASGAAPHREQA
jgi:hypothetical protein